MTPARALFPAALAGFAALAGAAMAEGFIPPAGCTLTMTVQSANCTVEQHYVCEAAPDNRWRAVFGEQGLIYVNEIDAEAQWLRDRSFPTGGWNETELPATDPASVSTLLSQGVDDWSFTERRPDGSRVRIEGEDRLDGGTVVIDGEVLQRTAFRYAMSAADGSPLGEVRGREYVSERFRRFFGGTSIATVGGTEETLPDRSPVRFDFEGDAGFGVTVPMHGCGAMMSALPQAGGRA